MKNDSTFNGSTVFANGIWKSGNHMLVKLCKFLEVQRAEFGISAASLVSKWYPVRRIIRGPRWEKCPVNIGLEIPVNVGTGWIRRKIVSNKGNCIGGHVPYTDNFLNILKAHRVTPIQIIRDPSDIVCSFAHWIEKRPDYYAHPAFEGMTHEERILAIIEGFNFGGFHCESLATVMDRSYGWLTRPDEVLVVRFEDLVGEKGGGSEKAQLMAIENVACWIGAGNVDIRKVGSSLFGDTATFRKGKQGLWRGEFTPKVLDVFNKVVGSRLKMWGYE